MKTFPFQQRLRSLPTAGWWIVCLSLAMRLTMAGVESTAKRQVGAPASAATNVVTGQAGYKFMAFVPRGVDSGSQKRPLILFLHGACPDEDLEKFRHFGPLSYALKHEEFPALVICPATSGWWSLPALDQLLRHAEKEFPVDPDRIYVTGYSNGGHATWLLAQTYSRRFAAIAPVAGAGDPLEARRRLRHLPVWIFHGAKDDVVPAAYGRAMAEAMQKAGAEVKTTFYEDRGHDTWGPPYAGPELYKWFLKHRRTKPADLLKRTGAGRAPSFRAVSRSHAPVRTRTAGA